MAAKARKLRAVSDRHLAELRDVEEFAHELPDNYLECRELGHIPKQWALESDPNGGWIRTIRCTRCRMKRRQHLDIYGRIVGRSSPEYPEGYLREGHGRIDMDGKGLLRLESMKRKFSVTEA